MIEIKRNVLEISNHANKDDEDNDNNNNKIMWLIYMQINDGKGYHKS
jgi:hypothetical protein